MAQEKYPDKCLWDFGPNQKFADDAVGLQQNGLDSVPFSQDKSNHHWFDLVYNNEGYERVLAFKAQL